MKSIAISMIAAFALSGCAGFSQAYSAKEASDEMAIHAAQKNAIQTLKFAICAVPYGDVIANPDFQATAKAACLPSGATGSDLIPAASK